MAQTGRGCLNRTATGLPGLCSLRRVTSAAAWSVHGPHPWAGGHSCGHSLTGVDSNNNQARQSGLSEGVKPRSRLELSRGSRSRTGRAARMKGSWVPPPSRDIHSGQQCSLEAAVGVEPTRIRFAGEALIRSGIRPNGFVRTLGRIRTAGLNVRNVALCSAELRGSVRAEGFEPPQRRNRVTAGPNSPTLARSRGVPDRIRTGASRVTVGRSAAELQPPSLPSCVPAEGLEPPAVGVWDRRSSVELHGQCGTYPGLELNQRPPSYQNGALPLSYQDSGLAVRRERIELSSPDQESGAKPLS